MGYTTEHGQYFDPEGGLYISNAVPRKEEKEKKEEALPPIPTHGYGGPFPDSWPPAGAEQK